MHAGLRRQLAAALIPTVVLALAFAALVGNLIRADRALERADRAVADLRRLYRHLVDLETGLRGFQVTAEDDFLDPYREAAAGLDRENAEVMALLADDPIEAMLMRRLDDNEHAWRRWAEGAIAARQGGRAWQDLALNRDGKHRMDQARELLSRIQERAESLHERRARTRTRALETLIACLFALSVGLGAFSAWLMRRQVRVVSAAWRDALDETRRMRGSLAEEQRFHVLVNSIRDYAIYLLDREGCVASWSPGAQRIKGYDAAEILGRHFSIFYPPEARAAGLPEHELARAAVDGVVHDEGWRVRKDGSRFWADTTLSALYGPGGRIDGFAKVARDVTQRREEDEAVRALTTRLTQRTDELTAANAELEAFSYSVSHDLRAPLRAIEGFSRVLAERHAERLDEQGRHYLERVRAGSQRMATLIDDLLRLSRVTRMELRRQPIDLGAMGREILDELARRDPGRTVVTHVEDGLTATGDARLVRIALENLLGNAWKFTSKRAGAHIELGGERDGGPPTFFVRDDGAGFDMAHAGKLFAPFQRLHEASEFEGTGVGLATVQRIVHRHGGRIWVESAPGRGTTFRFTLGEG